MAQSASSVSALSALPDSGSCARHVGRVGALAVALGIGTAVLLGTPALAVADTEGAGGAAGSVAAAEPATSASRGSVDGGARARRAPRAGAEGAVVAAGVVGLAVRGGSESGCNDGVGS